jgi:hypothetical protein
LESRDDRGATALDPDAVERAQPRRRRQSGFPIDPDRIPSYSGSNHGSSHGATPHRRSSQQVAAAEPRRTGQVAAAAEPRRTSQVTAAAEPRRSSQMTTDPMAGATRPFQRPRGKRYRMNGDHDPHHTQTFGPAEPLPPSPAAVEATNGWFEPSLRTEAIPDLIGLVGDTSRTYDQSHLSAAHHLGAFEEDQVAAPPPGPRPLLDMQARPWLFPVLLSTTFLAVGMVIGALLFGNHGSGDGAPRKSDREVIVRCSDPPER